MSGKILVMTRQNANQATADLTMRATSDGQSVDFTVHVILNAVIDEPPYIVNPVSDVVFDEYPQTQQVNLNGVATDPDDPDENITYSIVSNSNPSALTATMSGKILVMTRQNANQATADLTMRATSDGQYVNFNVHVIINAVVDLPPYIVTPIPDVVMDEFPKIVYIDLNGAATDPDDPDELIEYTMLSNSNEEALLTSMDGRILMLERLTEEQAEADIAMRATSDGQYVDFNIHVIMNQVEGLEDDFYGIKAYPNPTEGRLTLSIEGVSAFGYHVFSHIGQCVMNGEVTGNESCLDLSHLNKGIYYISIEWDDNMLIKKVIVK
ncbi:MAG: T9SS type A sorting domain-containing protein [Bacteroidales bacterium]|nr:T9SS type A sorting domain-containing protein [Bacteroidales bacterium]